MSRPPCLGGNGSCLGHGLAVIFLGALVLLLLKRLLMDPARIQAFLDAAHRHPMTAGPLFILINVAAPLVLLPSGPFQILAGAVFGLPLGFLVAGSASFAGNVLAFVAGRELFQEKISAYLTNTTPSFPAIQRAVLAEGWRLVFLLRLSPVLPDSLMNYVLAMTATSISVFASATALAMIPWVLLYVYLGNASKDIVATLSGGGSEGGGGEDGSPGGVWLRVTILVFTLASGAFIVFYLGRVIKKAIAKAEAEGDLEGDGRERASSLLEGGGEGEVSLVSGFTADRRVSEREERVGLLSVGSHNER